MKVFADFAIIGLDETTQKAIDHFATFKDEFANGINDLFEGKFDAKNFGKSMLKSLGSGLISSATGGAASSPGEFFSKMLFGGLNGGGAGGGGGVPATGGFAGGGGANDILKGAAGQMNFGKIPGVSKLLGKIRYLFDRRVSLGCHGSPGRSWPAAEDQPARIIQAVRPGYRTRPPRAAEP
jgi:hypothetical protein